MIKTRRNLILDERTIGASLKVRDLSEMLGNELMNDVLTLFLTGIRVATELKLESLDVYNDSQLVVNQVQEITSPKNSEWWHIWMR